MRKWIAIAAAACLLGLAALVCLLGALPFVFEDRILAAVQSRIDEEIDATVRFETLELDWWSGFPGVTVEARNLEVLGKGPFEGVELARLGRVAATLDLARAIRGETEIEGLVVADGRVNVVIDEQGRRNTDVVPPREPEPATGSSPYALTLRAYRIENVDVVYDDRQGGTRVDVWDLDHSGDGTVSSDVLSFDTRTDVAALTVVSGGARLLDGVKVGADLQVALDQRTGRVTFGENRIALNELAVGFAGSLGPSGDDLDLDLRFEAKETDFRDLLSLVPAVAAGDLARLEAAGTLALEGSAKGVLPAEGDSLPAFDLAIRVADGRFRYPDLPTSVDDVQLDLAVRHPGGAPDLLEIDARRFHLAVAGTPIDGRLSLRHPETDPELDAHVEGAVDLAKLRSALPAGDFDYAGNLEVNIDVGGRVSQFQAADVDSIRAKGLFRLTDFSYTDPEMPDPVTIERLDLTLDPHRVDLADLRLRTGASDLHAVGQVENVLPYVLTDGAVLVGSVVLRSGYLDLDRLSGEDEEEAEDGGEGVWVVPNDLDLSIDAQVAAAKYDGKDLRNLVGRVAVRSGVLTIDELRMETLGGTVKMEGTYAASTPAGADVDMKIDGGTFAVAETVGAVDTLGRLAPIARNAAGSFRTGLKLKTRLGSDYAPDIATLFSSGRIETRGVAVEPAFMRKVADLVGNPKFGSLDLSNAAMGFEVENGRVHIAPTKLRVAGNPATLSGSTGTLDQTLDLELAIEVPTSQIASALGGEAPKGKVDLEIGVGGTFTDPKVTTNLADLAKGAVVAVAAAVAGEIADDVVAQAKLAGDRLVAEAEKAAAALRAEAKKAGDKVRDEARKAGDKLKKKAKGNAVQEAAAKEAAKKLEKEADKKADKLEKEADKKADALVAEAKKNRDRLVEEAKAKAAKTR